MKKLLYILLTANIMGFTALQAQPTDKPLHNFYVDKDDIAVKYQQVFMAGTTPARTLARQIKTSLMKTDNIEKIDFDTAGNVLTGHLKNIVPKYYKGSTSKEFEGDFTIEVKDGKYRVFIHDMYLKSDVNGAPMGIYGYYGNGNGKQRLEDMSINRKGTEWKQYAYDVLPDLDDIFTKKFTLGGPSDF